VRHGLYGIGNLNIETGSNKYYSEMKIRYVSGSKLKWRK